MSAEHDDAPRLLWNPSRDLTAHTLEPSTRPWDFHRRLPGYRPTRLTALDGLAAELDLEHLWLKDESHRLGVPSFKILGASWATYRALSERLEREPTDWTSLDELRRAFQPLRPLTLITATDGNHGRALARVASWLDLPARIFVPEAIPPGRLAGIRSEGADAIVVDGTFDDAVEAALAAVDDRALLIQDTALAEDELIPRWICEGYATLFWELEEQLAQIDDPRLDLVFVQVGVGSLAAAAAAHFRRHTTDHTPQLVGVEPASAACLYESATAGQLQTVSGPFTSMMDCLNAGKPSVTSLGTLLASFDAFATVSDRRVAPCMLSLARAGVVSGTTGVAGLVGLTEVRDQLKQSRPRVLLLNTEGAADPQSYAAALLAASNGSRRSVAAAGPGD
jgi:diaminopropionate ammonia-lyase